MVATRIPSRAEALKLLGLEHPLDYEAKILADSLPGDPPRGTGWTTRLCVEAAVDVMNTRVVMLVGQDNTELEKMMQVVRQYVTQMNGLHPGYILGALMGPFLKKHMGKEIIHDVGGNPIVVYQDHWHPGHKGKFWDARLLGPFGEIREVRMNFGGRFTAHDYDGEYLLDLEEDGLQELLRDHRFRIRVVGPDAAKTRPGASAFGPVTTQTVRTVRARAEGPVGTKNRTAPAEVDGVWLKVGDYVLVTGQRNPKDDGIYVVGKEGEKMGYMVAGGTWNKAKGPPQGTPITVLEGDVHAGTQWVRATPTAWTKVGATVVDARDDIDDLIAQIGSVKEPKPKGKTLLEVFAEDDAKALDGVIEQDEIEEILGAVFGENT